MIEYQYFACGGHAADVVLGEGRVIVNGEEPDGLGEHGCEVEGPPHQVAVEGGHGVLTGGDREVVVPLS